MLQASAAAGGWAFIRLIALLSVMALFCLSLPQSTWAESKKNIRLLGDSSYYPYAFAAGTEMKGFYSELIRQVAQRLPDYEIELQPIPWKRGLAQIESGEAFGLFPPYRFDAERPYIYPYSRPLYTEAIVIFCRTDRIGAAFGSQWPADYLGMSLATNLGFTLAGEDFWQPIRQGQIHHYEFGGNRESLLALVLHGRVDCYANDRQSIIVTLRQLQDHYRQMPVQRVLAPIRETTLILEQPAYIGYTRKHPERYPEGARFIEQFDAAWLEYQNSKAYRQFVEQFWTQLLPESQ
jgi:polar amino acid transport system substrate-binding protein